ncbi:hypothetical protein EV586_104137 [Tumebacillus sp. BK434]|uniref:hypothetical protein n=1 Tax=Tumebacillus sp. BK434 TaxID=2512169 RepID=UPI00104BAC29|nr:hypothetical protein [Tumebacillus sp. BK434]TCP54519.1 hypothetical protein EV586_104137 [Tumebacillus sp. BK434]
MAVFLFVSIAILAFWGFADKTKFRAMFPILITAVFLRFLDHYVLIDWFKLWVMHGEGWRTIWIPMLANLTIWSTAAYFYIQFLPRPYHPKGKHFVLLSLYTALFVLVMCGYMRALLYFQVLSMRDSWTLWHSALNQYVYFLLIYVIYRWLTQPVRGGASHV